MTRDKKTAWKRTPKAANGKIDLDKSNIYDLCAIYHMGIRHIKPEYFTKEYYAQLHVNNKNWLRNYPTYQSCEKLRDPEDQSGRWQRHRQTIGISSNDDLTKLVQRALRTKRCRWRCPPALHVMRSE